MIKDFRDKFAIDDEIGGTGSFKMTAVGCFMRHGKTRSEMDRTPEEDLRVFTGIKYDTEYDVSNSGKPKLKVNWAWAPASEVKEMMRSLTINGKRVIKI